MSTTDNPQVCARCGKCCVVTKDEEKVCFPVFPAEIDRISSHLGNTDWTCEEANDPILLNALKHLFPGKVEVLRELFPDDGSHMRLATRSDGSCTLLGEDGCILTSTMRPWHCRLFPLWALGDQVTELDVQHCLARQESANRQELLDTMGLDLDEIRTLVTNMKKAWGLGE